MFNDLRFALRMLQKNPGFTAVAVLTLALGIGGTTAIFSVVYGALLNPWPYVHSDRLGVLMLHNTALNQRNWAMVSAPEWLDFQQQNQVFSDVIGGTFGNFLLTGSDVVEQYWGSEITPNTFRVLGVPPVLGRGFTDEDGKSGAVPVVMLSYKVWHSKFGGDPGIVGRTITLNHQAKTIIGVVPKRLSGGEDLYVPAILSRAQAPGQKQYYLQGRLKPGVSLLYENVAAPRFRTLLLSIFAGLAVCLAIAGVYGVMAYVVGQKTNEIGVRMALGASSTNVLWLVFQQGMAFAILGLALGVVGAVAATRLLTSILFEVKPSDPITYVSVTVLLGAVALLACYIPARRATKVDPVVALRYE